MPQLRDNLAKGIEVNRRIGYVVRNRLANIEDARSFLDILQ